MMRSILFFAVLFQCSCSSNQPKQLSGKIETLDVMYINWACDCADFIEQGRYIDNEPNDEDLFFIEPAHDSLKIPDEYFSTGHFDYYLRLSGQFYVDKGIPDSYEQKTPEKPEKARVFRYDSYELIKK